MPAVQNPPVDGDAQVKFSEPQGQALPACRPAPKSAFPLARLFLGALVLMSGLGCAHRYIPNTDIEDNPFNREVVAFCEKYRKAVERRSVPELVKMAHPMYFEDGGNADASDDMDYSELREYLETKFVEAKAIRYEIKYHKVGRGRKDEVLVDYTYSASYKIPTAKGDIWRRTVADNRLELVPDGESYKVIAGM